VGCSNQEIFWVRLLCPAISNSLSLPPFSISPVVFAFLHSLPFLSRFCFSCSLVFDLRQERLRFPLWRSVDPLRSFPFLPVFFLWIFDPIVLCGFSRFFGVLFPLLTDVAMFRTAEFYASFLAHPSSLPFPCRSRQHLKTHPCSTQIFFLPGLDPASSPLLFFFRTINDPFRILSREAPLCFGCCLTASLLQTLQHPSPFVIASYFALLFFFPLLPISSLSYSAN